MAKRKSKWEKAGLNAYKKGNKILGFRAIQKYAGNLKILNSGWEVLVVDTSKLGGILLVSKQFKTKSEAIKFAKSYMRKN